MKKKKIIFGIIITAFGIGAYPSQTSADVLINKKIDNIIKLNCLRETNLLIKYPTGVWGDISPNSSTITGSYDTRFKNVSMTIKSPAKTMNSPQPTNLYNVFYKVVGSQSGTIFSEGYDIVGVNPDYDSFRINFRDSAGKDKSYKIKVEVLEVLVEGIPLPVNPYYQKGEALAER